MPTPYFRRIVSASWLLGWGAYAGLAQADVRFNRDVRPILADNCLSCHGPDARERKGNLRLDVREDALKPAKSGEVAIQPGKPEASEALARIESADADEVMPPLKSHKQLTAAQKAVLRQWIAEGAKYEAHWAFTPIERPPVPAVRDKAWPRNEIDAFILAKLEQEGLRPAPSAPLETLMRRASFGVTGLPPDSQEVKEVALHHDDHGYTTCVERWLASPQYGEHWARHWMDLARYADSAGYELDYLFTHSWRYRDWLTRSFAANKPMDRFIQEQIAGDELWPGNEDAADGTLFLTIGPRRFEGGIQRTKERDNEWFTDLADTTGRAFLGLTMGCTRCHDHKFDPLSQNDYYGLQAVFADCEAKETREGKGGGAGDTRPAFVRPVFRTQPLTVQVLRRGEVEMPLHEAAPSLPAVLPGGGAISSAQMRRTVLAKWLTAPENPLTARVLVNRVWQWHFGHGLVRTASDFGRQGEAPSHPELLDWLASELIASGWDLRHLQKLILESATYRQSSFRSAEARARDPENRWFAGFPRRRLQAEELRDALLSISREINLKSYGAPVTPPVEPWALAALRNKNWTPSPDESEWRRRSLYMVVRRSIKLPFSDAFNAPDNVSSCPGRESTVVASQALTLLNGDETLSRARALAGSLWNESHGDAAQAVDLAWWRVFCRAASGDEKARTLVFLGERERDWQGRRPAPGALPTGLSPDHAASSAQGAAWVEWCLALLNTNEFVYVD